MRREESTGTDTGEQETLSLGGDAAAAIGDGAAAYVSKVVREPGPIVDVLACVSARG